MVDGFVTTDEYGNLVVDRASRPPEIEVEGLPPGSQHKREGRVDIFSLVSVPAPVFVRVWGKSLFLRLVFLPSKTAFPESSAPIDDRFEL